ncbi:hypothetical protein SUGI_0435140 [Cryptomeria japonica]|nr:hypothetical protein SUGI_0435140 [Cryptomeria japonica]
MDAVFERLFQRALPFSHPGVKVAVDKLETIPFPFTPVDTIKLEIEEQRSFDEYIGVFRTSSALVGREEILEEFLPEFEAAWGAPLHVTRAVKYPLCLKVGKV